MPAYLDSPSGHLGSKFTKYLLFLIPQRRNAFRQYFYAFALTMIALLARMAIAPIEGGVQYVTFFPAVALSAVIGGLWPGLFSALIGMLLATYLFWPPFTMFTFDFRHEMLVSNAVFAFDAILVCSSIEAMHRYYHKFVEMLAAHKKAEEELRLADQRKDEFLAMLAHELRNPLVPIRNAAHIIGRLGLEEPRIKWAQEVIETQVTHLTRIVDDLMDVSRIVRGKITLRKEEVEFTDLAERVLETARTFMEDKGHQIIVNLPSEPVRLDADPVRLSQVLLNLLDNAAKYTPDNGTIWFDASVKGQEIEIQVRDNGEGMSQELLNRVFDIFQQGERSLDRAKGGLGIGLTLVQRISGMHGGRVKALSPGPGHGSTFIIWLPIKTVPSPSLALTH